MFSVVQKIKTLFTTEATECTEEVIKCKDQLLCQISEFRSQKLISRCSAQRLGVLCGEKIKTLFTTEVTECTECTEEVIKNKNR